MQYALRVTTTFSASTDHHVARVVLTATPLKVLNRTDRYLFPCCNPLSRRFTHSGQALLPKSIAESGIA